MNAAERAKMLSELTPAFTVAPANGALGPFVLSSPHSGQVYPKAFLRSSQLPPLTLRKSEDTFVEELFADAPGQGAPLIAARFPRAYLDVNREPYELDPKLFREKLPEHANTRSPRVISGLGTIARIVADSEEIYREPLKLSDALQRIELFYKPYHRALSELLSTARRRCGIAILVDCHSMPSVNTAIYSGAQPDFVIGDRFGCSCDRALTRLAADILKGLGYDVSLNRPYAGGYITENYGDPFRGVHALQLEINRGLYMNERTFEKNNNFDQLSRVIRDFMAELFALAPSLLQPRAAAE